MDWEVINGWLRKLRRSPLLDDRQSQHVNFTVTDIQKLIPHRAPFLLLDAISGIDLKNTTIIGQRFIDPADPIFQGHFPGDPVYPGVLQIEMVGQLALCMASLLQHNTLDPDNVPAPAKIRASRVHQSVFYSGVIPGDNLTVTAALIDKDELAATAAGQIYCEDQLCAATLLEVCFLD